MRRLLLVSFAACSLLLAGSAARTDEAKTSRSLLMSNIGAGESPSIATDGTLLHVAFEHHGSIYFSTSADAGKTWSTAVQISSKNATCQLPKIAAGLDGSVDVVWQNTVTGEHEAEIYFARSGDQGKNWSEASNVSNTPEHQSSEPAISIGADNAVHVAWVDALSGAKCPDIYYCASSDGKNWSKREDVSNTPGVCSNPAIAIGADSSVHVAWTDSSSGEEHPDIYYACKHNGAWSKIKNISHSPRVSAHPSLACGAQNKFYLVWSDNSRKEKAADIWCAISHTGGEVRKPLNISNSRGMSTQPVIAAVKENLAIVWSDTSSSLKESDIWARTGIGEGFSNVLQLTQSKKDCTHPAVAVNDKQAFIVYEEQDQGESIIRGSLLPITKAVGPAENVDQIHYGHER
jgi:hypothetical protein